MAGEKQDSVWPLPVFYFKVEIGSLGEIAFKEVSGMDAEAQGMETARSFPQSRCRASRSTAMLL